MENYAELMFTEAVRDLQEAAGTRAGFAAAYPGRTSAVFDAQTRAFLAERVSFYIASVNADGWPYIQHRGGPPGFIKITGPSQIACGDYPGNKQFITQGNLQSEARVSLFFMDYLSRARLKVQGYARLMAYAAAPPDLQAIIPAKPAPERVLIIDAVALDWNCPKYIPVMLPEALVKQVAVEKFAALTRENEALRAEIARLKVEG
ncbi:MAG: pyridoxamine 5'-phosphate oxidase family protein [Pseudomonadota bacterium]